MWKRIKRWWRIRKLQRQLDYAEYVAYDWALGNVVRDHYRAEVARLASELALLRIGALLLLLTLSGCHATRHDATPPELIAWKAAYDSQDLPALVEQYAPAAQEKAAFDYGALFDQSSCTKVTLQACNGLACGYVADVTRKGYGPFVVSGKVAFSLDAQGKIATEKLSGEHASKRAHRAYPFAHLSDSDVKRLRFFQYAQAADLATTGIGLMCGLVEGNPLGAWVVPLKFGFEYLRAREVDRDRRQCRDPWKHETAARVLAVAPATLNLGAILAYCL